MTAIHRKRRDVTAKQLATKFGVTDRTIRNYVAEPREDWEARGRSRQDEALALLESGLTYSQVAQRLGITRGTAAGLVHRARRRLADTAA